MIMTEWRERTQFVEEIIGVKESIFRRSPELVEKARRGPRTLHNLATGEEWDMGVLELPTLGSLRESTGSARSDSGFGKLSVLCGTQDLGKVDVGYLQSLPENDGAVFQVASNFNALELMSKFDDRAMTEVGNYVHDRTQGPFASISAAPGLIFRHYYPFHSPETPPESWRQVYDGRQLELLGELPLLVRNGYLELQEPDLDRELPLPLFRVAHHRDVQVTFGLVNGGNHARVVRLQRVSQVFTATADLACTNLEFFRRRPKEVEKLVKTLLRGAYEGTLRAALSSGRHRVFLTLIGGGVFANPPAWMVDTLEDLLELITETGLSVVINTYRGIPDRDAFDRLVALARRTGGDLLLV